MSAESFEAPSLEVLGELLPAYEFEAFIAQGGMGAVYKARQRSLDRDVAIKILPREMGEDPEFRRSFETEAKAMARLNHPNLIGVYDFGDVDGMPYIVMEFVNGKSLFHSAYNLAVDPTQAVAIVKGICDGLAHAHENGVIHRDIKPANILLTPKAVPKIGDFGLARPAGADSSGIIMGTPGYAAPEITRHPDHADRRSDLFALGVVLYELLIGRCPPYDHQPPPSTVVGCDPALDRICEKAMHPVADMRYPSAEAMSEALEEWQKKGTAASVHHPVTPGWRPAPAPSGRRRAAATRPMDGGSGGMVKTLLMTAGAIVVAAIGWGKYKDMQTAQAVALQSTPTKPVILGKPDAPKPVVENSILPEPVKPPKPDKPASNESPMKSLVRLKADLAAGKRSEMPQGTVSLEDSDFFVVPTPSTWQAAAAFAESYGGHLFVVSSEKDLDRLSLLVPAPESGADPGLWLGAGLVGAGEWVSVDGSPWKASAKPEGKGTFAILDGKGGVKAREDADRYPFAIQWQRDGSNPATVEATLKRTGESIAEDKPVFPPGTLQFQGNYVYVATHAATAAEAADFAKQAHGHLITLAAEEKDSWLADKLSSFTGNGGFWVGAEKEGDDWKWSDGAPWGFTRWEDDQQVTGLGTHVKIIPGEGWRNAYRDDAASGFIVEWSPVGAKIGSSGGGRPPEIGEPAGNLPPQIVELERKAKDLVANLEKERQKALVENSKTYLFELETWFGDLSKNEQTNWRNDVTAMKARIKDGRVPAKVTGFRLSERMAKIAERGALKQTEIDSAFKAKAIKIRDAYVSRVTEALGKAGDAEKPSLEQRLKLSGDLDAWLQTIASTTSEGPKSNGIISSQDIFDPIVGRWKWVGSEVLVIRADGTATNETHKVDGVWKLISEGNGGRKYALNLAKGEWKDTVTLSKDATKLEGLTRTGDPVNGTKMESSAGDASNPFGTPTPPQQSAEVDPIVGPWRWDGGTHATYTYSPDGTVRVGSNEGKWKLRSETSSKRTYEVTWPGGGVVDTISITDDPNTFEGTNSNGMKISATRIRQ